MSVRVQSILALKCYVVAFGDLENVRVMLCVASGPRIRYWVGYRGVISPRIILTPTIHPNRVKWRSFFIIEYGILKTHRQPSPKLLPVSPQPKFPIKGVLIKGAYCGLLLSSHRQLIISVPRLLLTLQLFERAKASINRRLILEGLAEDRCM